MDAEFEEAPGYDLFAFSSIAIPDEPGGKHATIARVMRAVGWVAFGGAVLAVLGSVFTLGLVGAFPFDNSGAFAFGQYLLLWVLLGVLGAVAFGVTFMIWSGRILYRWVRPSAGTLDAAKQYALWVTIGGGVGLFIGIGTLLALGFLGLGIALLVLLGDGELRDVLGEP